MSATIPESMRLDDLLKATGYDCPVDLQGKTFDQATEGGSAELEDNKTVSITENGVVEITPTAGKDGMKKVTATVNVSGGGGDVPTDWYLWQDNYGDYQYLPFATAPDTLDSLKLVFIGKKLAKGTEIETYGVAEYTKNSDTEFFFTDDEPNPSSSTFTRITEDVPIGGGGGGSTVRVYCWIVEGGDKIWLPSPSTDGLSTDPENFPNLFKNSYISNGYAFSNELMGPPGSTITIVDSTTFKFNNTSYVRASDESEDFNLW